MEQPQIANYKRSNVKVLGWCCMRTHFCNTAVQSIQPSIMLQTLYFSSSSVV